MNKFFALFFGALFATLSTATAHAVQYLDEAHSGEHMLRDNKHVFAFIPSDVKGIQGNTTRAIYTCDEQGNEIVRDNLNPARRAKAEKRSGRSETCATFYSKSTDTSWVISFVPNLGTTIRARQIHELKGGQLTLWAKFDPTRSDTNIYASSDAQKFAGISGNNTEVARSSEPSKSAEGQALQIDPADIAKKALGTIFKGF